MAKKTASQKRTKTTVVKTPASATVSQGIVYGSVPRTFSSIVTDWKQFEVFLAGIYHDMADVVVQHDVTLTDKEGIDRQIDVLVRFRRGAHDFMVIVEAKHWAYPVERAQIDELAITVQKFNASKGVFFTTVGYQDGARRMAVANGIDIFVVKDANADNWWPSRRHECQVQVFSFVAGNNVRVDPTRGVRIGVVDGVWPKSIRTTPPISFHPERSRTPLLNRVGTSSKWPAGKTLEDLIEESITTHLPKVVSPLGPINGRKDCVGHLTYNFELVFAEPVFVQERQIPFVTLEISEIAVPVLIRIEQRSLRWLAPGDLAFAVVVENVVTNERFQVGRGHGDEYTTWMPTTQRPSGTEIPHDNRVVIVAQDKFRPEMFSNPWQTFGKISISAMDEIPPSKTLQRVLDLFQRPSQSPPVPPPR